MLSETWPPGYCQNNRCDLTKPKLSKFSIHGLWPQQNTRPTVDPSPCQTTKLPKNNLDWPSLTYTGNRAFWQAEWDKHGSCSLLKPIEYFTLTIDLYHRANIKEILRKKGIISHVGDVKRYTKKEIEGRYRVAS
ncbi:hypothetical protein KIW84_074619 [Lathyrus oleraceus]|uniref:Uncharacterized protein n=2 Tax=Pisum sativum TaxID=3888 RepID=A0A9D4ZX37_PEA|nr:hypothetical protein KIW84_074619 [Pisum sativum]